MNNDFFNSWNRLANDFNLQLRHSWKSGAKRRTRDQIRYSQQTVYCSIYHELVNFGRFYTVFPARNMRIESNLRG